MASTTRGKIWRFIKWTFLIVILVGLVWVVNLIWFKPFSLDHFYSRTFAKALWNEPETVTSLGVPILSDWAKDDLTEVSIEKDMAFYDMFEKELATLRSYDYENMSEADKMNTDILAWYVQSQVDGRPYSLYNYPVNPYRGIQNGFPNLMTDQHQLKDKSDVEAYISRLNKFELKAQQTIKVLKVREDKGFVLPTQHIDKVLDEMRIFIRDSTGSIPKDNILYTSFVDRVKNIEEISEDDSKEYSEKVEKSIKNIIIPSYQKFIKYFEGVKSKSTDDVGAWVFPEGEAYYRHSLKANTTTNYEPDYIHNLGLSEVARITSEMREIIESFGIVDSTLSVKRGLDSLQKVIPSTKLDVSGKDGAQKMLDHYKKLIDDINLKADQYFDRLPKAEIEVRAVPEALESGSGAYYSAPPSDGSRPGIFYTNTRGAKSNDSIPTMGMKTLAYHEGVPGHHFHLALQSEMKGVPMFRNIGLFPAFNEGWALYSEQLAYEMGMYDGDPLGNLGRLRAELFRAVRLVVDTGIHYKKWSRKQAIQYMEDNAFIGEFGAEAEIDRYINSPGQACAYKIGMLKILDLREKAQTELGDDFNIKKFHNIMLKNGSVPLDILEKEFNKWLETQ